MYTAHSKECEKVWIKNGIPVGVSDEEFVQRLISLDASCTFQEAVTVYQSYEATKTVTSALRAPPSTVRTVSQYKKGKKVVHKVKVDIRSSTPPSITFSCGKQHSSKTCLAAEALCNGCDR